MHHKDASVACIQGDILSHVLQPEVLRKAHVQNLVYTNRWDITIAHIRVVRFTAR